jgi:anti-anti-sigma factor
MSGSDRSDCETFVIELGGDIDLEKARAIGDDLCNAIHRRGSILVDLSGVTFLDSSGIGMMIRVHNYAETWRQAVVWRGARPEQRRILSLTGVDQVLILDGRVDGDGEAHAKQLGRGA